MIRRLLTALFVLFGLASTIPTPGLHAAQTTIGLGFVSDLPSGQPVGTTVTWTVNASGADVPEYRLSVKSPTQPFQVMYDFTDDNTLEWTPLEEGWHLLLASVHDRTTAEVVHKGTAFYVTPRATTAPVVTSTSHPLVALYSAPPCSAGEMQVAWQSWPNGYWSITPAKACQPNRSLNFYIAGMRAETIYRMIHRRMEGGQVVESGPVRWHRTGSLPRGFPVISVLNPPDGQTSAERVLLQTPGIAPAGTPLRAFATDLEGNVLWFDRTSSDPDNPVRLLRPVSGGTTLGIYPDEGVADQILREVDLAGHVVRETNTRRISDQLATLGQDPFRSFHHEARRLPDGKTVILGSVERILTDVQGAGAVDVIGDYIVVLDTNWQVTWVWNSFDHLDVTRIATLNETCIPNQGGCPPLFLDDIANDWTHGNAIAYSPADGNLIFSMRHQDWVIKIDYQNGVGTGGVVWRLGPDGDFSIDSSDPFPWFSHQHDPNYLPNGNIAVYDNSNMRCVQTSVCSSRGQVYSLDETAMTASLVLNADLQNYSSALGAAQPLQNGNIHFDSGFQNPPLFSSTSDEVLPDGSMTYSIRSFQAMYRSFRMIDLYHAPP